MLGIHLHLIQNAQLSLGVENCFVLTSLFICLVLTMLVILEKESLSVVMCSAQHIWVSGPSLFWGSVFCL